MHDHMVSCSLLFAFLVGYVFTVQSEQACDPLTVTRCLISIIPHFSCCGICIL